MKNVIMLIVLVVVGGFAYAVGSRLSADALGVITGMVVGVLVAIPPAVLVLVASSRKQPQQPAQQQQPAAPPPPVVIMLPEQRQQLATRRHMLPEPRERAYYTQPQSAEAHGWYE